MVKPRTVFYRHVLEVNWFTVGNTKYSPQWGSVCVCVWMWLSECLSVFTVLFSPMWIQVFVYFLRHSHNNLYAALIKSISQLSLDSPKPTILPMENEYFVLQKTLPSSPEHCLTATVLSRLVQPSSPSIRSAHWQETGNKDSNYSGN